MNRLAQLQQLSTRLDSTLNQFALTANDAGEYPWQTAQREKRNRRMVAGVAGTAAVGAGAYGARKLMGAANARYGTQGMDGIKAGAADLVNRADDVVKAGAAKVKGYAGQAGQQVKAGAQRAGTYGKNVAGAYGQARKGAMVMGKATGGKGILGAGLQALRKVRFDRADQITALEAKLDAVLFEEDKKSWPKNRVGLPAGSLAAPIALYGADRMLMNRAKKKYGFTPTRATAYGEGVTDAMRSGKRAVKKGMVHAAYRAEPVIRKVKGALGLRKVTGMIK